MPKKKTITKEKKKSTYYYLNKWLYDGSKKTSMPLEVVNDKSIGPNILLYHYQNSYYNLYISELFNNFGIYSLDRLELLYFLKETILLSGYKPPFQARPSDKKTKFYGLLKSKFPYLKSYDVNFLIDKIEESEEKDCIYESFGLNKLKKKKVTKKELINLKEEIKKEPEIVLKEKKLDFSLDKFLSNFKIID